MTFVSAGHIVLTPTQPVDIGRLQRESNPRPPHQESRAPVTAKMNVCLVHALRGAAEKACLFVCLFSFLNLTQVNIFLCTGRKIVGGRENESLMREFNCL